jgi:hypothetical protein
VSKEQGRELLKCGFCQRGQDEALMLVGGPDLYICDDCVDDCIKTLAEADLVPDLRPLERHYVFKPPYLTQNDVRGSLSLLEFDSVDEEGREELVREITEKLRKNDLLKALLEAVGLRMYQVEWEVMKEKGCADEARYGGYGERRPADDDEGSPGAP